MPVPSDCKYAKSHEWTKLLPDGTVLIGITDYAQNSLGDITYVQLPKVGAVLAAGEGFGVVESVKAASDVYAPLAGEVVEGNAALGDAPETVNDQPEKAGWFAKIKITDKAEYEALMDRAAYEAFLGTL